MARIGLELGQSAVSFLILSTKCLHPKPRLRVATEASILSDVPGLKTFLAESLVFFKPPGRITHTEPGKTIMTLQGDRPQVNRNLDALREILTAKFDKDASMQWPEPKPVSIEEYLENVVVEESPPELKRSGVEIRRGPLGGRLGQH